MAEVREEVVSTTYVPQERMLWERGWDEWRDIGPTFDTAEEAQEWVDDRWKRKGESDGRENRLVRRVDQVVWLSEPYKPKNHPTVS